MTRTTEPLYRCVSDRYDPGHNPSLYTLDDFDAMCFALFEETADLHAVGDDWHDNRGPVLRRVRITDCALADHTLDEPDAELAADLLYHLTEASSRTLDELAWEYLDADNVDGSSELDRIIGRIAERIVRDWAEPDSTHALFGLRFFDAFGPLSANEVIR
jgi:hypothetical protein